MKHRFLILAFTFGLVISSNVPVVYAHEDNPQSVIDTTIDMRTSTNNYITLYWYDDVDQKNLFDVTYTEDLWASSVPCTNKMPTKEGYVFKEWFDVDSKMNLETENFTWSWLVEDKNGLGLGLLGVQQDHCLHYVPVWEKLTDDFTPMPSPALTPTAPATTTPAPTATVVTPTSTPTDSSNDGFEGSFTPPPTNPPVSETIENSDSPEYTSPPLSPSPPVDEELPPTNSPSSSLSPLISEATAHVGSLAETKTSAKPAILTPAKTGVQNDILPYVVFFGGCSIFLICCGIISYIIKKEENKENKNFSNNKKE